MEALPPTYVRFFTNISAIMEKTRTVNANANKYMVANEAEYKKNNKNFSYPFLSAFLLDTGIRSVKSSSEEKTLNENSIEKGVAYKIKTIEGFILKSYPHWKKIIERDSAYFLNLFDNIFTNVPYGKDELKNLFIFKKLDGSSFVSDEEIGVIWNRLHSMIKISIKHIMEHNATTQTTSLKDKSVNSKEDIYKDIDITPYLDFLNPK